MNRNFAQGRNGYLEGSPAHGGIRDHLVREGLIVQLISRFVQGYEELIHKHCDSSKLFFPPLSLDVPLGLASLPLNALRFPHLPTRNPSCAGNSGDRPKSLHPCRPVL